MSIVNGSHRLAYILIIPVLLALTVPAEAQKKKAGRQKEGASVQVSAGVVFSTFERDHIVRFYSQHRPSEVQALPPGIRKNLARGKPLPPGIAKKVLPADLEVLLPERPGYMRLLVGLDVLLVDRDSGLILDVIVGVVR